MHWDQILTVFAVIATNLGTVLALYLNLDRKLEENRKETNDILKSIRDEMTEFHQVIRDFHGRQERIDAEFKAHLLEGRK